MSANLFPAKKMTPQQVGLLSAAVPSPFGDALGLLADAAGYAQDPKSLTPMSGLLSLAAMIPGIPRKPKLLSRAEFSKMPDEALTAYTDELTSYVEQLRKKWDSAPVGSQEKAEMWRELSEVREPQMEALTLASHRSAAKDLAGGWKPHELSEELGAFVDNFHYLGAPGLKRLSANRSGPAANRMSKAEAISLLQRANPEKNYEVQVELARWAALPD